MGHILLESTATGIAWQTVAFRLINGCVKECNQKQHRVRTAVVCIVLSVPPISQMCLKNEASDSRVHRKRGRCSAWVLTLVLPRSNAPVSNSHKCVGKHCATRNAGHPQGTRGLCIETGVKMYVQRENATGQRSSVVNVTHSTDTVSRLLFRRTQRRYAVHTANSNMI